MEVNTNSLRPLKLVNSSQHRLIKQLKKVKADYESTEGEISNLKMEKRMNEEKMRDLELLAKTQTGLEEIRKKKLNEEQKKLDATKEKCKNILETNIPKFKELISVTKENIAILKNKHRKWYGKVGI